MLTDQELVTNIKEEKETEDSILEILSRHLPLIVKISSKYAKPLYSSGSSLDEIQREKEFIVYKAAKSFKEDRGIKFSSYLGTFVRWYCLNRINENKGWHLMSETEMETLPASPEKDSFDVDHVKHLIDRFEDENVKKVFELRFFSGNKIMSWGKIGKSLNVSGQTVNNWYRKGIKALKNRAESNL